MIRDDLKMTPKIMRKEDHRKQREREKEMCVAYSQNNYNRNSVADKPKETEGGTHQSPPLINKDSPNVCCAY